jgi:hypothetical protein
MVGPAGGRDELARKGAIAELRLQIPPLSIPIPDTTTPEGPFSETNP